MNETLPAVSCTRPRSRDEFAVAIVCALAVESSAVRAVFDEEWEPPSYGKLDNDSNSYTAGRIGRHNVVLAYLPGIGGVPSASATANLKLSFPRISLAFLVGICGGNPIGEDGKALFLGDVVISDSVVQYNFGRRYADKLRRKDTLHDSLPRSNTTVRSLLHKMRTTQERKRLLEATRSLLDNSVESDPIIWRIPDTNSDVLFPSSYRHKHRIPGKCPICDECQQDHDEVCEEALTASCSELGCDGGQSTGRNRGQNAAKRFTSSTIDIHFGTVASADEVVKSSLDRDRIAKEEQVIAFEMEGAGSWENIPTIIVKGICDYADSHKSKDWQGYASAASACCVKALLALEQWTPVDLHCHISSLTMEESRNIFKIPNIRVHYFTGRERELLRMDEILLPLDNAPRVGVLRAVGGQGKSQLALEYCRKKRNKPFQCIIWLDANSDTCLLADFTRAAELLRPGAVLPSSKDAIVSFVSETLAALQAPWLLVFDNYDDVKSYNILDYLPTEGSGAILVTSRHAATNEIVQDMSKDVIEVGGLDEASGISLILQRSCTVENQENRSKAMAIVRRLSGHPLTLLQAAAYIKRPAVTINNFLNNYEDKRKNILETVPNLSQYRRKLSGSEASVAISVCSTWELSFQQLERLTLDPDFEANFLTLLSLFDGSDISEVFFKHWPIAELQGSQFPVFKTLDAFYDGSTWNSEFFVDVITKVSDLSLLQIIDSDEDGNCHVRMHPLVKDWIQVRSKPETLEEMRFAAAILFGDYLLSTWRHDQFNISLEVKRGLVSHVEELERISKDLSKDKKILLDPKVSPIILDALENIAKFAYECGFFLLSEQILKGKFEFLKETRGKSDLSTLECLSSLAVTYRQRGLWNEAEAMTESALAGKQRILGLAHNSTLRDMGHLSSIYCSRGKLEAASTLARRTVFWRDLLDGAENNKTLSAMHYYAAILADQGKFEEAENLSLKIFKIRERRFGLENPQTIVAMANLAMVYMEQNRLDEAETMYKKVFEISRQVLGIEHPERLSYGFNMARIFQASGHWKEAEELHAWVFEARKLLLGEEHPDTLMSQHYLLRQHIDHGRLQEGKTLGRFLMKVNERVFGKKHLQTRLTMRAIIEISMRLEEWEKAQQLQRELWDLQKLVLGANHKTTICSMMNLAYIFGQKGLHEAAEELLVQGLEAARTELGEQDSQTVSVMTDLANTYTAQRQFEKAEALELQIFEINDTLFGSHNLATIASMDSLSGTYASLQKWSQLERLERRKFEAKKSVLGEEHLETLASMANIGMALFNQGKLDACETFVTPFLETLRRVLGETHRITLSTMVVLAATLSELEKHDEAIQLQERTAKLVEESLGETHFMTLNAKENLQNYKSLKQADIVDNSYDR